MWSVAELEDQLGSHLENPPDIDACLSIIVREISSITYQTTGYYNFTPCVDGWHGVPCCERDDLVSVAIEKRIAPGD
jgi:hypothetical protein